MAANLTAHLLALGLVFVILAIVAFYFKGQLGCSAVVKLFGKGEREAQCLNPGR